MDRPTMILRFSLACCCAGLLAGCATVEPPRYDAASPAGALAPEAPVVLQESPLAARVEDDPTPATSAPQHDAHPHGSH